MPKNEERIYVCVDCGGQARYVTTNRVNINMLTSPRCEACKKVHASIHGKKMNRAKTLAKNEAQTLNATAYHKGGKAVDLEGKLPTTYVNRQGKRMLIRGMDTPLLIAMVTRANLINKQVLAMARELRTREHVPAVVYAKMNRIDPPPCKCGKPGLFIVGRDTYCREHHPQATARLGVKSAVLDKARGDWDEHVEKDRQEWERLQRYSRGSSK